MNARYVLDKLAIQRHLELFADAAALPSENFVRCGECGCSYRYDEAAMVMRCPLCSAVMDEDDE